VTFVFVGSNAIVEGKFKIITSTKANAMFGNGVIWAILKKEEAIEAKAMVGYGGDLC
jgi:hypothetical protein